MHEVESMAYYGQTPWHGLGTRSIGVMTAAEALSLGGLAFDVEKQPIYLGDGTQVADNFATVRTDRLTDNVLGVVGRKYTPLQNVEAFEFFDAIVARQEAIYHTVGSLRMGRRVWILAKMPGEIRVIGDDITEKFVLLTNTHDGTSGVQILLTPVRVVCQNTLRAALSGGKGTTFNIRHTRGVRAAVHQAAEVMGFATVFFKELQQAFQAMATTKLAEADARAYLERCLQIDAGDPNLSTRSKNILEDAARRLHAGKGTGLPGVRGTVWAAYNGLTELVDHRSYRSPDVRLDNAWFGGAGQAIKQRAFDEAVALAA
jgi:phage/plasmid-like protein (TIGR03299 family)